MGIKVEQDLARESLIRRFMFHGAKDTTAPKDDEIRRRLRGLALWLYDNVPDSPERSRALSHLQASMMWSNAAVAIHTEPEPRRDGVEVA